METVYSIFLTPSWIMFLSMGWFTGAGAAAAREEKYIISFINFLGTIFFLVGAVYYLEWGENSF